ncbi:Crp/Fnr family transcriptional regulator [Actinomadura sp. 21ATH]|uniref:Crp/Fnr family transcriptional regulator n=1 Tax=Actinomadura sp. 21ATH TaxID=1735444 RepID=UPI0035C1E53C
MIDNDDARSLLARYSEEWRADSFLAGIGNLDVEAMLSLGVPRRCGEDEVLMRQGDRGHSVFLLLEAVVKVSTGEGAVPPRGKPVLHAIRSSGDIVGEFAFLDGGARCATVLTAKRDGVVMELPFDRLAALVTARPRIERGIRASAMEKTRAQVRRRSEASLPAEVRVARALVELVERHGREAAGRWELDVGMKQEELGSLVNASRNAASSALSALRDEGVIDTRRAVIFVLDMDRLRVHARL